SDLDNTLVVCFLNLTLLERDERAHRKVRPGTAEPILEPPFVGRRAVRVRIAILFVPLNLHLLIGIKFSAQVAFLLQVVTCSPCGAIAENYKINGYILFGRRIPIFIKRISSIRFTEHLSWFQATELAVVLTKERCTPGGHHLSFRILVLGAKRNPHYAFS